MTARISFNDLAHHPNVACVSARLPAGDRAIRAARLKGSDLKLRNGKRRTLFVRLDHTG
jgi:hypothetical protein